MSDLAWTALGLPVRLAFFLRDSESTQRLAWYPSPAGATQAVVDPAGWADLESENPVLTQFESDVETLLVNRLGNPPEYFRVPLDECYRLVGLIRWHWRGFSGGTEAWAQIQRFMENLKQQSRHDESEVSPCPS